MVRFVIEEIEMFVTRTRLNKVSTSLPRTIHEDATSRQGTTLRAGAAFMRNLL